MKSFFRLIALLEGVSYILLLFIAVPIKYLSGDQYYVQLLGMPHGLLFVLYVIISFKIRKSMGWDSFSLIIVLISSVIPFGTFYIERKYFKLK